MQAFFDRLWWLASHGLQAPSQSINFLMAAVTTMTLLLYLHGTDTQYMVGLLAAMQHYLILSDQQLLLSLPFVGAAISMAVIFGH